MVGRVGPETGKLITTIGLVVVTNKRNHWYQRMMTHGG
jgi:hypothetical protein